MTHMGRVDQNARVTHFVVQSYRKMGRRLIADEPRVVKDERECLRVAESVASRREAVIAFSRTGDADTGDFDDPVILATHGDVPEFAS
jgi:hypothetical protein